MAPAPYMPEAPVKWTAESSTARSVTGEIEVSKTGIAFENGQRAKLKYLGERQLLPYMGLGQAGCASFYTFEPSFAELLLRDNTLFGAPDSPAVALALAPSNNGSEMALYVFQSGIEIDGLLKGRVAYCGSFHFSKTN